MTATRESLTSFSSFSDFCAEIETLPYAVITPSEIIVLVSILRSAERLISAGHADYQGAAGLARIAADRLAFDASVHGMAGNEIKEKLVREAASALHGKAERFWGPY
jgi:hypothetical protein